MVITTDTTIADLDEACSHVAASRRRAAAEGLTFALAALTHHLDQLLDHRLALASGKNPGARFSRADICQGLSPREAGEFPGPAESAPAVAGG